MQINTSSQGLQKALAVNSTATSFASKVATMTEPISNVINMGWGGGVCSNILMIRPYGVGADGTQFDIRVIGWWRTPGGMWSPTPLLEATCTLSAETGCAGGEVSASESFCDAISVASAYALVASIETVSQGSTTNIQAHIKMDFAGAQKIEFLFDMTTATSGNALFSMY